MPLSDWMLEANEEISELNRMNPGRRERFLQYVFNSLFVDYEGEEAFMEEAMMTRFTLNIWKNTEVKN